LSQTIAPRLDPPSRSEAEHGAWPTAVVGPTDQSINVSPERPRDSAFDRTLPVLPSALPFRGSLKWIFGGGADLLEHRFDAASVTRPAPLCLRREGGGISIDLTDSCRSIGLEHAGRTHRLNSANAIIIDRAQPVRMERSESRYISLILDRRLVAEMLGADPAILAGRRLPSMGLPGLLQSLMRATIDEVDHLSADHQAVALAAALGMATSVLLMELRAATDERRPCQPLYQAARHLIERTCSDPEVTPARIATALGCSRAALYRMFEKHDASIAAAIWSARLERAQRLLGTSRYKHLLITDIALRSGFIDQPTFNRMFKRRYGLTPREARSVANVLP
jgi:AraC family transcriptional activator of tynA and feaB